VKDFSLILYSCDHELMDCQFIGFYVNYDLVLISLFGLV